jgi:hypothetical protein
VFQSVAGVPPHKSANKFLAFFFWHENGDALTPVRQRIVSY